MQSLETILQSIQATIASIFSNFLASMLADPVSGLFFAVSAGAIAMGLIVWVVMSGSRRIQREKIQSEIDEYCARLRSQLRNKVERLDLVEKSLQEKDRALTVSERERAELAQQFVRIEELTGLVQSEAIHAETSLDQDMTIGQMAANLQKKLEGLHNQIVRQAATIAELESEVAQGQENLAQSIVSKTQKLPEAARAKFEDQVIKPLYEQIEGIRERVKGIKGTVQAIPHQTRENLNKLVIDPLNEQIGGIKETVQQFPGRTKDSLDKLVVHPLQEMLDEITAKVSSVPQLTSEQFHALVLDPLQHQLEDLKSKSRQFSGQTKETFEQRILHPLQQYVDAMVTLTQQFPAQTKEQIEKILKQLQEQQGFASRVGRDISKKTMESIDQWIVQPIQKQLPKHPHVATSATAIAL